ncbi:leucine-rich repeat domain-containing protein [Cytophagaceae bacterium YF14B1]|uniref:Leucine-rich repeat domain-containing protein n=1 Tax=Xanthocytophaga flava TaxID=3048013 RepID=A0AAE3UAE2_9BACT|nr:leucine-rich repeat domain-containing protein [Xanthocytophaga flavus]MDJ1484607.1 leucine-rich repeat domain-containing protein [Xanthocytophaga flavus]
MALEYKHYYYLWGIEREVEAIYLSKPIPVSELKTRVPNIKGIHLEFDKTEFRPARINHDEYLLELLQAFPLQELKIDRSRITTIPEILWTHPLELLQIEYAPELKSIHVPDDATLVLEKLVINGEDIVVSPKLFSSPVLHEVNVIGVQRGLEGIDKAVTLKRLQIDNYKYPSLPIDFTTLHQLEYLSIGNSESLEILPELNGLTGMEECYFYKLPALSQLPNGWDNLQQLTTLKLSKIATEKTPVTFNFTQLDSLTHLQVFASHFAENPFGNMPALTRVDFEYMPISMLPAYLFQSRQLKWLKLEGLPQLTKWPEEMKQFDQLTVLNIRRTGIETLPDSLDHPLLERIYLEEVSLKSLPECWAQLKKLTLLSITNCPDLEILSSLGKENTSLSQIELTNLPKLSALPESWCQLTKLVFLSIKDCLNLEKLSDLGKENFSLDEIRISNLPKLTALPDSWDECPVLAKLEIRQTGLRQFPDSWQHMRSLSEIRTSDNTNLQYIPGVVAVWPSLQQNWIAEKCIPAHYRSYVRDLPHLLQETGCTAEQRKLIGTIIFAGKEDLTSFPNVKDLLMSLVNKRNLQIRQLVWDNLSVLNDNVPVSDKQNTFSVSISGNTKRAKTYYKEKLKASGFVYQQKLSADTQWIVVGDEITLPPDFWKYPHRFLSETELDTFLDQEQPGFMTALEQPELENLRKLVWSNDPVNEELVLEMIKGGGIPDEFIPDLLIVAKTTREKKIKDNLRKLLAPKLSKGASQILSNPVNLGLGRCPYLQYERVAPDFDVAQMAVCHYKRTGKFLQNFFYLKSSLTNRYRAELFNLTIPAFTVKPHYVTLGGWNFTAAEINQILQMEIFQGRLERLILPKCNIESIMDSLLLHSATLQDIQAFTDEKVVPAELEKLSRLQKINIHGDNLKEIPDFLPRLKYLKEIFLYSKEALVVPENFKGLKKMKRLLIQPMPINAVDFSNKFI